MTLLASFRLKFVDTRRVVDNDPPELEICTLGKASELEQRWYSECKNNNAVTLATWKPTKVIGQEFFDENEEKREQAIVDCGRALFAEDDFAQEQYERKLEALEKAKRN